jgi:DNA (cytosine-5)-methyltransferase 1
MNKEQEFKKTVAEFFAGIGLMRAGLEQTGWEIIFANDIDPMKQRLYLNHYDQSFGHFLLNDIHKTSPNTIPSVTLATASFPCTDLSVAGKREGLQGKESSSFWGFIDILNGMEWRKPPLILLENVTGFITSHSGKDLKDALIALNKLGYFVDIFIIDAVHFVPQSRARFFIVGKLSPTNNINNRFAKESLIRPIKLREFINNNRDINWDINNNLPQLPKLKIHFGDIIDSIPKNSKEWWSNERVDYLLNQTFDRHLDKIKKLKENNFYTYLTAFRRVRSGKSMAEIRFDGIAGCLRTPKGGSARQIVLEVGKGEVNVRLLTPKESAKLMGANDFKLSGTATESLFGFGDAVCVPVISWIAQNYLDKEFQTLSNHLKFNIKEYAQPA